MKSTPALLLSILGHVSYLAALFAAVWIGYREVPALTGSFISAALIVCAYVFSRFPQLARVWTTDRSRMLRLSLLQLAGNYVLATALYWLGRGLARHF